MDAGRKAPSESNIQSREFIGITDDEVLSELTRIQKAIGKVSAAVAVVCDPSKSDYWLEDMAATVEKCCWHRLPWVITPAGSKGPC